MRVAIVGLGLFLCASQAMGADCMLGSNAAITVQEWAPAADDPARPSQIGVQLTVASALTKPTRMVRAFASLYDALDRPIMEGLILPADAVLAPGAPEIFELFIMTGASRLAAINPADVVAQVCTVSVVYEDGSKEEF